MATVWNERTLARMLALAPRLRRLAARLSRDAHEADDLVQDAWVAVLTQWPGEHCELEPWAKEVLRNTARKRARRAQTVEWDEQHALDGAGLTSGSSLDDLARAERATRLRAAIEALPEPYRGTLIQRFYAARSVGEIATDRELPRATVSTQLRRALERLRARLALRRDLLPLAFPWRVAARRARAGRDRPQAAFTGRGGVALGAAGLAAVIPLAYALSSGREARHAADPESASQADGARADQSALEFAFSDRRMLAPTERAADPLAVEARSEVDGAPLTGGRLSVWDESGTLRVCVLDAAGRGRIPDLAQARLLVVELARTGGSGGDFRCFARPEDGRLALRVGSGPTVRFTLAGAGDLHPSELRFGVRSSLPGAIASPRLAVGPGAARGEYLAQLPESFAGLTGYDGVDLFAATVDGLRAANAPIDGVALAQSRVLELALEPRAVLELDLAPARGEALANCVARIAPQGGAGAWNAEPDASGRIFVGGLRPGSYLVSVEVAGREPWSSEIELAAGRGEQLVAGAPPAERPQRGPIRGRILRDAPDYDGAIVVALEGGRVPQYARARWLETAGGFEAHFEFPPGDSGDLTIRPIALDGLPVFLPPTAAVGAASSAAAGELSFVCRGRRANPPVDWDVRAADTLDVLADCTLEFELPGGTYVEYKLLDAASYDRPRWSVSSRDFRWKVRDGSPFDWIDDASEVRWRLTAPGFAALEGDRSAWSSGPFTVRLERALAER